jgi:hypothetical protein
LPNNFGNWVSAIWKTWIPRRSTRGSSQIAPMVSR